MGNALTQTAAASSSVTAVVHVAHAGLVIVGAVVVVLMLSPLAVRRRRAALAELHAAAASGNLVRLAELRAAGHDQAHHTVDRRHPALLAAVAGSVIAAAVHAIVSPEHFHEALRFGVFFLVLSLWAIGWAIAALRRPTQRLFAAGVVVNSSVLVLWAVTRTVGLPFGLAAVEPVGGSDLVASLAEVVAVLGCISCSGWTARLRFKSLVAERRA
jgi:hypothetical protein